MKTKLCLIFWFALWYFSLHSQASCSSICPIPSINWTASQCEHYESFSSGQSLISSDWKVFPSSSAYKPIPATVLLGHIGLGWRYFADFSCYDDTQPIDNTYTFRTNVIDYRFSFDMYCLPGKVGYFSMLNSSLSPVFDIFINGSGQMLVINSSGSTVGTFSYPQNEWMHFNLFYHTSDKKIEIFRNDFKVFELKNLSNTNSGFPSVANFYTKNSGAGFFLGGVCLVKLNNYNVVCTQEYSPVCLNGTNEQVGNNACYAGIAGYLPGEYHNCTISNNPCDDCDECFTYKFDCSDSRTVHLFSSYCPDGILTSQQDNQAGEEFEWEFRNNSNNIIQVEYLSGTNSTSANPLCRFPTAGTYTICFRVYKYNSSGRFKYYECCYVVKVAGGCTKTPSLYVSSTSPNSNSEVSFNTTGSDIETFSWRIDDPSAYISNVSTSLSTFRCKIPSGKDCITVCLTVGNGCGMVYKCLKICRPNSNCGNKPAPHSPILYTVNQNKEVNFQNIPTMDSYNWTLPDGCMFTGGTSATSRNPIIKIPDPACSYIVCLKMFSGTCYSFCYCFTIKGQSGGGVTFDPEEMSCANSGQEVLVPVRVKNFTNMTSVDITALVNPTNVADFIGAVPGPSINPNAFVYQLLSSSKLKVAWAGISSASTTLSDNDIFCYLKLKLKGAANSTATITFETSSAIVKQDRNTVVPNFKTGSVCVNGTFTICGKIVTEENKPVKDATVDLIGQSTQSVKTDVSGNYCFTNVPAGTFTIKPKKLLNPGNGVEIADIADIQGHILGSFILNSPFKIIAADVDNNKTINSTDIGRIIPVYFNKNQPFSAVESWRFIPKSFSFPNVTNPFQSNFPESRTLQISKNESDIDFTGIKMGDVDLDSDPQKFDNPNQENSLKTRTQKQQASLDLKINKAQVMPGRKIVVPVYVKGFKNVISFGFSLAWDATKFKYGQITGFNPNLNINASNFNLANSDKGRLGVSWYVLNPNGISLNEKDTLFSIEFTAIGKDGDSTILNFNDFPITTTFSNNIENFKLNITNGIINIRSVLIGVNTNEKKSAYALFPNPASNQMQLSSEDEDLVGSSIKIMALDGRVYSTKLEILSNNMMIDISQIPIGLYHLCIVNKNKSYKIPFSKN